MPNSVDFPNRPSYINKFAGWANNLAKFQSGKQESVRQIESLLDDVNEVQSTKADRRFAGRLFNLVKSVNTNSKTVDKLVPNQVQSGGPADDYIEESGLLNVICLQMLGAESSSPDADDCLKYAYCRPAGRSIDTNLLDADRLFRLKGMQITLASVIEKITGERLLKSKLALPRVTLLRTQELTKISLIYEQENELLVKFAITDNQLSANQFGKLASAIVRVIKFKFGSLEAACLDLNHQSELHKLLHIVSFLLDSQLSQAEIGRELSIDLYLCEQLTISVELMQCVQQVMIDFEYLTWLDEFDQRTIDSIRPSYSCLTSAIFYKGKLICSNLYPAAHPSTHSDLKLYLKLAGLITLSRIAQTKFVKWLPVYLNSAKCFLLVIIVEHILYATVWQHKKNEEPEEPEENGNSPECNSRTLNLPRRLINEGLHFIVRLVKKTSLIEEIDYELRLQTYWHSLPVSLDEFRHKKGHILTKSFDLWSSLQSARRSVEPAPSNVNKLNQWRKALISANIHRNVHLNSELMRGGKQKVSVRSYKQKLSGFNLLAGQSGSAIFSIYNSLRSNSSSTADSLNSGGHPRTPLFDHTDPFASELQCELNALSRALKQVRTSMVDYLVCFLIEDNRNAVYQAPVLSSTLSQRLGASFLKKFRQNCAKLDQQSAFLDVKEIACTFEARLPDFRVNSASTAHQPHGNQKVILLLNPHARPDLPENGFEASACASFKTVKFWLQLIRLDNNWRTVYLCFADHQVQQSAIDQFLFNNSGRFR